MTITSKTREKTEPSSNWQPRDSHKRLGVGHHPNLRATQRCRLASMLSYSSEVKWLPEVPLEVSQCFGGTKEVRLVKLDKHQVEMH